VGRKYSFLVSSPYEPFIKELFRAVKSRLGEEVRIGEVKFRISKVRKFKLDLSFPWQTATPIVLKKGKEVYIYSSGKVYKTLVRKLKDIKKYDFVKVNVKDLIKRKPTIQINPSKLKNLREGFLVYVKDVYFSFKQGGTLGEWLELLRENSLEKYKSFFSEIDLELGGEIFDVLEFRREVSLKLTIKGKPIVFIGTTWKVLGINRRLDKEEKKFYEFLMDCGLGVHNSLGFGFVNLVD
jgi:CRISPR/Cas system endoribonuclease Cas6 (RAMP superfamily)